LQQCDIHFAADPITGETNISEFHIPYLHPTPASVLDYLPKEALVLVDNLQNFQDTVNEIEEHALKLRQDYLEDETLPQDFPIPYLTFSEIEDSLTGLQTIELGPSAPVDETSLAQRFAPGPRFGGRLKDLLEYMYEHYLGLRTAGDSVPPKGSFGRVVVGACQNSRGSRNWPTRA
jgi:hypothetical protein